MTALYSDKQWEYIAKCNDHRWNIKIGAVRSGKSYVDIAFVIVKRLHEVKDKDGWNVILGVSNGTIERNVLQPMREVFGKSVVGDIKSFSNTVEIFGQEVVCIGAEKVNAVGKIRGMSIKYAYGDEITEWSKDVFMMLESRLDKPYSRFDGTCNPESPNHWFKEWLDKPKLDIYIQSYVIFDNPFLSPSFVQSLCNEYEGTVFYDRYILGKWSLAEGLIYPRYKDAVENAPQAALSGGCEDYGLSIDYGTQNAFAAVLWAYSGGIWYACKEYYWSGRDKGIQKTDEEYAEDLDTFVESIHKDKIETIIDPSAASFIALLRKKGNYKVRKADNDVLNGIRETSTAMHEGLIKIDPSMKNTIEEFQGYRWDDKSGEDKPVKEKDHAMDAIRYFVKTKHIVRPKKHIDSRLL